MERTISRRQLLRKAATLGAGLAFAGPILAACGPTPTAQVVEKVVKETVVVEKPVEKVVEKVVTPTPAKRETIVLRMQMRAGTETSEAPIYVERPGEYMKANPYVQIKLEPVPGGDEYWAKVETLILSGTLSDILFTQNYRMEHQRMIYKGALLACDDWMKANGISKNEWIPAAVNSLSSEGKQYGFPKNSHSMYSFIFINNQAFKEAGLQVPDTYGATHDKIKEWALKLTKGPKEKRERFGYYSYVGDIQGIVAQLRSLGGDWLVDGTTSAMDSEKAYKFASWNMDLIVNDRVSPVRTGLDPGGDSAMFAAGRMAMIHAARHRYKAHEAAVGTKFEWSQLLFPRYEYSKGWPAVVDSHTPTKFTKYPDEAIKFSYAMADRRFSYLVANGIGYLAARLDDLEVIGDIALTPWMRLQYKAQTQEEALVTIKNFRGFEYESAIINELDKLWLEKEKLTPEFMKAVKKAADAVLAKPIA